MKSSLKCEIIVKLFVNYCKQLLYVSVYNSSVDAVLVWRPETLKEQVEPLQGRQCEIWFRMMKRAAAAPNALTGTERVNADHNSTKTKVSCSMKDEMVLTCI